MKANNAVEHVSLTEIVMFKQRQLPKSLFDSTFSMPGLKMQLSPIGVLCTFNGCHFVIPYAKCGTITLMDGTDARNPVTDVKGEKP